MSPRPLRLRKISNPPSVSGFKPYGNKRNTAKSESIFLHYEEFEALRLCDYEMLNHHQASVQMDVSRPTLTRIYAKARQKIAEALVLGRQIIIEGGKIYFDSDWYSCSSCGCFFNNPDKQAVIKECPLCKSADFSHFDQQPEETEESPARCNDKCVCPACGYEKPHQFGHPCKEETCSACGRKMLRKGSPQNINI
jgi:uncharacterized protein